MVKRKPYTILVTAVRSLGTMLLTAQCSCIHSPAKDQRTQITPPAQTSTIQSLQEPDPVKVGSLHGGKWALEKTGSLPEVKSDSRLQCVDEKDCWLVNSYKTWKTTDGGKSWKLNHTYDNYKDTDRSELYINPLLGWLRNTSGYFVTEDGGSTWVNQPQVPVEMANDQIRKLRFLSDGRSGWIAGSSRRSAKSGEENDRYIRRDGKSVSQPEIYWTDNAGAIWHRSVLPARNNSGWIDKLEFFDDKHGYALGYMCSLYSDDGGRKWHPSSYGANCVDPQFRSLEYEARSVDFFFLNMTAGWLLYDDGRLLGSHDGGKTWCDLAPPTAKETGKQRISKLFFADSDYGLGLGLGKTLYESSDGGRQWTEVAPQIKFEDMFFLDARHGWLVSETGLFRIITDDSDKVGK